MKKRIEELDIVKGLSIIFVIFLHLVRTGDAAVYVVNALGEGVMFLFFFVSGYTYRAGRRKPLDNIKMRFAQILKPYFSYALVLGVLQMLIERSGLAEFGKGLLSFILTKPTMECFRLGTYQPGVFSIIVSPYWFMRMMLMSSTIFFLIADWALKDVKNFAVSEIIMFAVSGVILSTVEILPFNWQLSPVFAGAMLFGAWCGHNGILNSNLWDSGRFRAAFAVSVPVMFGIALIYREGTMAGSTGTFGAQGALSELYYVVISTAQTVFALGISAALTRWNKYRLISWFGKNSLYFFLLHVFVAHNLHLLTGLYSKIDDWMGTDVPDTAVLQGLALMAATTAIICGYILLRERIGVMRSRKQKGLS